MAWPNSQTREVQLAVQNAQVSGSGTISSFPVLITRANLPDEICSPTDSNRAQSDGGDIRAGTSSDMGTQLPMEIVKWEYDSSDGAADADIEIWVLRDLNTATDTDIWLGYNTSGTTSKESDAGTFGRDAVWAGFDAVWHLAESGAGGSGSIIDSTGNGNDGTPSGSSITSGANVAAPWGTADGAIEFVAASSDQIGFGDVLDMPSNQIVISAWLRNDNFSAAVGYVNKRSAFNSQNAYSYGNAYAFANTWTLQIGASGGGSVGADYTAPRTQSAGAFYHTVFAYDGSQSAGNRAAFWRDANSLTITGRTDASASPGDLSSDLVLGRVNNTGSNYYDGAMDEVRIAFDGIPSSDWVTTEYNNQSSPATFIVEGTPQDTTGGGGPPAVTPYPWRSMMGVGR